MKANKLIYGGIFLTSLATLMYEVLLTRIFSITTWYHFAFLAISIAMIGMTVGAILVYVRPREADFEQTAKRQAVSAFAFSISSILAILGHLSVPMFISLPAGETMAVALLLSLPLLLCVFIFSGISISLTLTRYPSEMHSLYAADFCGAALGCILLIVSLNYLDGISDVFLVGALASLAAYLFASCTSDGKLKTLTAISAICLAIVAGVNGYLSWEQRPLLHVFWSKGLADQDLKFERWNCFSRIRVWGHPEFSQMPFEFGYSRNMPMDTRIQQMWLDMDGNAAAILYHYQGDLSKFNFFKYDVSNIAYDFIKGGKSLVIGVGGGKDILAAMALGEKSVTGVEINNNIVFMMTKQFGDYTGHLERDAKVRLINDEARSFITRTNEKFDTIQATLVDTWAASASGAFALTENGLYTVEAWRTFLNHLTDHGILTVTRWYHQPVPAEIYRLVGLGRAALISTGVKDDPRAHIVLVRLVNSMMAEQLHSSDGLGTILVSKSPYTPEQLNRLDALCKQLGFEMALSPRGALDPNLALAADGKLKELSDAVPFNVSPATDDKPFFFQMLNIWRLDDKRIYYSGPTANNVLSVVVLLVCLVAVAFFSFYCFRMPMLMTKDKTQLKGSLPLFVYFFSIGVGFMLIELSQVQRFSILLGHPIYALSVVLFTLFLATGLGSLCFNKLAGMVHEQLHKLIIGLFAVSAVFGLATPTIVESFSSHPTPERIGIVILCLLPLGFVLGLGFPTGMRLGFGLNEKLTPWLWGINGAASVCGSVLSVLLSMLLGISFSYWLGCAFYVLAAYCALKMGARVELTDATPT
ncbi:MAG TPA: hypothetical protein V6C81_05315 [Planktothrix sp.]|jgi:hypothetical protein